MLFATILLVLSATLISGETIKSVAENTQQRYAVLKSYLVSGTNNVRWETMTLQDQKGFLKGTGKKQADVCTDMLGKQRSNGEEYERSNGKFKYKCSDGVEEVIACVGSDRTNKAIIPVGKTLDVNGFWHKCESFPNGSVVYTQASSCKHGDKELHVGEEINIGSLRLECQENGYKTSGCYYLNDENKVVPLNVGENKKVGKVIHYCEEKDNSLQYFSKSNGCKKAGKDYNEGETFSENHLNYKCANGTVDITNCYINKEEHLDIGKDIVKDNVAYRCYRIGGKIEYSEYPCGQKGMPSCQLEPIPNTPDDAPSLARGLKTPGFGSFALVQQIDSKVANRATIKLELDKVLGQH